MKTTNAACAVDYVAANRYTISPRSFRLTVETHEIKNMFTTQCEEYK